MLIQNGHQQLQDFTNKNYEQTITEVTKGVWFVLGLGHSNAIFIEAGSSVILIDTLDTRERGEKLLNLIRQNTQKKSVRLSTPTAILTTGAAQELLWIAGRKSSPLRRRRRPWKKPGFYRIFKICGGHGNLAIPLPTKKQFHRASVPVKGLPTVNTVPLFCPPLFMNKTR